MAEQAFMLERRWVVTARKFGKEILPRSYFTERKACETADSLRENDHEVVSVTEQVMVDGQWEGTDGSTLPDPPRREFDAVRTKPKPSSYGLGMIEVFALAAWARMRGRR